MTHTHTPGPWWRDDDGFIASGSDKTYITVASPNCSEDIDIDEREANARLIAAAPELLAHLKMLVLGISEGMDIPKDGAAITAAREAIAKAEGEA